MINAKQRKIVYAEVGAFCFRHAIRVRYFQLQQALALSSNEKSNLQYTRDITPKRVTSGGAHLSGLAPGQHSSEETSL